MDRKAFLELLQETFQREDPLAMDMPLAEIPEWDSLAAMLTLTLAKRRFGKELKTADLKPLTTVEDMYVLLAS